MKSSCKCRHGSRGNKTELRQLKADAKQTGLSCSTVVVSVNQFRVLFFTPFRGLLLCSGL